MNDLPDEIQHITEGFVPLGLLLSRLAQKTHNELQGKILRLAKIPLPAAAVNGNSGHPGSLPDDTSEANKNKKLELLNFVQDTHAKWTKALVISAWSRKAPIVSKLIDLMHHITMQRVSYDESIAYLIAVKRDLTFSRLPNPDLQTALQLLSTGDAPWMPDLHYIEPPPLSAKEQMEWVEELNTLLSMRLNLEEHEKIPYHFRDYKIDSGRVTFRVDGEFEVDLTIADEDFEKQFWFIDFRFLFTPAPSELTDTLRMYLEARVNEILEKDGLQGCYKFLHEFVLTHKITEFVRQAFELARGRWVDTLKVERLNRAMSIQYWTSRFPAEGPKSWIIVGVHSSKKPGAAAADPKTTSHLFLRWFKDNKEVKDATIALDDANISTEKLLQRVIGRHVECMLSTIHDKLQVKGRFVRREAALSLQTFPDNPMESSLKMQLGHEDSVHVRVSPINGLFSMTPQTNPVLRAEKQLNTRVNDPSEDAHSFLEKLRCECMLDEVRRRGKSLGWTIPKAPIKPDDIKQLLKTREPFQYIFLKKDGWPSQWYTMLSLSLNGDKWWLVEVTESRTGPRISTSAHIPLNMNLPDLTDRFFSNLNIFSAAMMSQVISEKAMHDRHIKYFNVDMAKRSGSRGLKCPGLLVKFTDVLKSMQPGGTKRSASWATDLVLVVFKGIQKPSRAHKAISAPNATTGQVSSPDRLVAVVDARFQVADRTKFSLLKKGNVERDVAYNPVLGVFALRLEAELGSTILNPLSLRLHAIERLVDCVDAIGRSNTDIKCETITLNKIVFTYSDAIGRKDGSKVEANLDRWKATLDLSNDVIRMHLEKGNPHLRCLDLLNKLLNSGLGFAKVPQYLAFTLPVLKALRVIEEAWTELEMNNQGQIEVFPIALDWFDMRYTMSGPNTESRRLSLQLRLKERRGQYWWFVQRQEVGGDGSEPDDAFKSVLTSVYEAKDREWQSFMTSATCEADDRIGALLKAIDAAVQSMAVQFSPSMAKGSLKQRPQVMQRPNRPRPPQQQQQSGNVVILD
ncbi:mediator complex subunit MED14-domain-containing protein [Pseudomassariella vexata]|uniref:Mediator of RNA polymerase II transcription subunit 14 n=1 Tax=Pseudomassariella vexata TaxID=1141098 RepID=A0A1Y2E3T8_9PEZI|nr:mediator complex subunit MED14-domain-containing protein [Pseudomassariella vexata]ORY66223.1 mediator complex subunit MED14-domain-containing protein [Pseudomassariella vexata]